MLPLSPHRWRDPGLAAVSLVLALGCALAIVRVALVIPIKVPFDYNEGWNAYHAAAAVAGHGLYPDGDAMIFNNYPPLSFYIVGAVGTLIGDHIVAGRILSLASFVLLALGIGAAVRMMGATRLEAAFSALVFVATMRLFSSYVGMDDPQLLGQAVGIWGVLWLLREPRTDWSVFYAALCFCTALFIKQNLVAQPLALLCWLALYDRPRAVRLAGLGLALAGALLGASMLAFGPDFVLKLFPSRGYSAAAALNALAGWSADRFVLLACALAAFVGFRHDRYVRLCALYAGIALAIGTVFAGGDGTDRNVFFDADIALAMTIGLALHRAGAIGTRRGSALRASIAYGCFCYFAVAMLIVTSGDWLAAEYWRSPLVEETAEASREIAFLRSAEGPALCTSLALCYWAGKAPQVDFFNLNQHYARHPEDGRALLRLVSERYFRVMQLYALAPVRTLPQLAPAIARGYRIDHVGRYGMFLVPQ
jgi:hypothetical protein